ncbi:unnamed protein product, partial [Mesorhabditis spiculigera]
MRLPLLILVSVLAVDAIIRVPLTRRARPNRRHEKAGKVPEEPLYTEDLMFYYGEIEVGTPSQKFYTDFDTGSSITWQACSSCREGSCAQQTLDKFDCSGSSTCNTTTDKETFLSVRFSVPYADRSEVSGRLFTDRLCLAGYCTKEPVPIGCADTMKGVFTRKLGGIFGLDIAGIPMSALHSIFEDKKNCPDPVFAFYLNTTLDNTQQSGGEITFCEADPEHYEGPISWVPVDAEVRDEAWFVTPEKIVVGQREFPGVSAVVDSGTTMMLLPEEILEELALRKLDDEYPCANATDFPVISLFMGAYEIRMTGADYSIQTSKRGYCSLGVSGSSGIQGINILGDVFMRKVYTVFDYGNRRIGFADLKTPTKPSCSTTTPHY